MFALYENTSERITTFQTYAEMRKEIFIYYGVNGVMNLMQYYRVAGLKPKAIQTVDAYLERLLKLPNVILTDNKGDSMTSVYLFKEQGTLDYEQNSINDFRPNRFYMLGEMVALDSMPTGRGYDTQIRTSFHTLATDVEYNQSFLKRIERIVTVDNLLKEL